MIETTLERKASAPEKQLPVELVEPQIPKFLRRKPKKKSFLVRALRHATDFLLDDSGSPRPSGDEQLGSAKTERWQMWLGIAAVPLLVLLYMHQIGLLEELIRKWFG